MKVVHWIFAVCLFTSSCDVILNFNLGGQVRLAQLLMLVVCLAAVARLIQDGRILWPRGGTALSLWVFIQFLFIPLSGVASLGLIFFVLLLFTVMGIFAVVQVYGRSQWIEPLMRVYMASFVFVGFFGLLQFALPMSGLPPLLTIQWIIHGRLPRINGFSYEPSYYATYLLMGWIMLVELRRNGARIAEGRFWKYATIGVGLSLFLSTSKTAWAFMIVELLARIAPPLWNGVRSFFRQAARGQMLVSVPRTSVTVKTILGALLLIGGWGALTSVIDPWIFLSGTGIGNTAAHSYNDRTGAALATWDAFKQHPFVGRSLGGVAIAIAARNGVNVTTMAQLRSYWGFPVPLDILVASGIWGVIPFMIFVWTGTFGAFKLATRFWPDQRAHWLRALARGTLFEWMALMTDQNLLRTYLWFHLALVAVVAYHLEFGPTLAVAEQPTPSQLPVAPSMLAIPGYAQAFPTAHEGPAAV